MKRYNWRPFFTDFRGERFDQGHSEEQRYQAFKARYEYEKRLEEERAAIQEQEVHDEALEAARGSYGQG